MDKQEIIEGNRLIAEFLGWTIEPGMEKEKDPFYNWNNGFSMALLSDLKFHEKWDWLMPVVEKMTWKNDYHFIDQVAEPYILDLREALFYSDISAAFNAIVSLIKWYNSKNKPS